MQSSVDRGDSLPLRCGQQAWSSPRPVGIESLQRSAAAQFLNVAVGTGESYVVGTDIDQFDGGPVKESPLTAMTLSGRDIGRPAGRWTFAMPVAVVDDSETLHVLWGEPRDGTRTTTSDLWPPRDITSIWAAHYSPRAGWSAPERVYEGKPLLWEPPGIAARAPSAAPAQSSTANRIALPVATFTGEPSQPLLLLRLRDGQWTTEDVRNGVLGGPVSPVFASDSKHEYLAYLGADARAGSDVNSVIFQRSSDGGRTWENANVISRSGSHPAYFLQIVPTTDDVVHLLWLQAVSPDGIMRLRHAMSRDGGTSWDAVQDESVQGRWRRLRAAPDTCGAVHVVFEDWAEGPDAVRLVYALWNDRWTMPAPLFPGLSSHSGVLATGRGTMELVFLARPTTDTVTPYVLSLSDLRR